MSENMKGGIGVAAGLVTILGFFGLQTIYDLFPDAKDQEKATGTQVSERVGSPPVAVGDVPVQAGMPSPPALKTYEVHVSAQSQWVDTGLDLFEGQFVEINATGLVRTIDTSHESVGPSGGAYRCSQECTYTQGTFGQLIGRVGNQSNIFVVGQHVSTTVQGQGRLYLAVNDCCNWTDNSGHFAASISVRR